MTGRSCSKRDAENLQTILKYCEDIEYFVQQYGSDEEDFAESLPLQYGCAFSLIQIGEHVKRLSDKLTMAHPEIDWKGVAAMRDFTVHNYTKVNNARIRTTVLDEVPLLEKACRNILEGQQQK